jgi:hypothetical protein
MVAGLAVTVHRFFFPKLTVQALPFPPVLTESQDRPNALYYIYDHYSRLAVCGVGDSFQQRLPLTDDASASCGEEKRARALPAQCLHPAIVNRSRHHGELLMNKSMALGLVAGLITALAGVLILWQAGRYAVASHGVGGALLGLRMDRIYTTTGYAVLSFGLALAAAAIWDWISHKRQRAAGAPTGEALPRSTSAS